MTRQNRLKGGFFVGLAVTIAACGGDDALLGERVPNSPPDTQVTASPPVPGQSSFTVEFFWTGSDPDGEVRGFEWRISNNGLDGIVDPGDTLQSRLPWQFTQATDSIFVVSADLDSFEIDVADTNQSPDDYRFWQTHTFFIRSVDEHGARDLTPAMASFTATTLAPNIKIDIPPPRTQVTCVSAARVLTFGWEAVDPDHVTRKPEAVRHILVPVRADKEGCLIRSEYENANPSFIRHDNPLWSRWIAYDAPRDSGRTVTLPRQSAGGKFLFAVQARDIAGAVTPTFRWGKNVRHVQITDGKYPLLEVCDPFLGCDNFVGPHGLKSFEIVSGQPLDFTWFGNADDYAGVIDAYRYGWNVVDPLDANDPGWQVAWGNGPAWRRAPVRSFTQGSPTFVVLCRDNSGTISRGIYQFQVIQIPLRSNQRDLLLVDDSPTDPGNENIELTWDRKWDAILAGAVTDFQRNDIIDAQAEPLRIRFAKVAEYKSVIWFTSPNDASFFHTRLAPESTTSPRYNWLEVYQARVGNILLVGPGAALNTFERNSWQYPVVFNVPAAGGLGFGKETRADGTEYNRGTLRWPYSGWCVEATDILRPALGQIFGEQTRTPLRSNTCDQLVRALVASEFLEAYPDAVGVVRNLEPLELREDRDPYYKFDWEEFYNTNVTKRRVSLVLRPCQVPMYRHVARRDVGLIADPETACWPRFRERSTLDGVPIAIASTRHTDTKLLAGSEDFLWGFHPHAFQIAEVKDAILWILKNRWQLDIRR